MKHSLNNPSPDYFKSRKSRITEQLYRHFFPVRIPTKVKRQIEAFAKDPLILESMRNGKQLNDALDLWMAVNGISPEDRSDIRLDSEKCRLFYDTPVGKVLTPNIWKMAEHPHAPLHVSAQKLRNNYRSVNPAALAAKLRISVATLYRRFGHEAVRRAWRGSPDYTLPNDTLPIERTRHETRRVEQIRQRAARFEVRA
jgi:hypothetical protein